MKFYRQLVTLLELAKFRQKLIQYLPIRFTYIKFIAVQ